MQRRFFRPSLRNALAAILLPAAFFSAAFAQAQSGVANADAGSQIYAANCAACHQAGGTGMADAFPPLAGHVPDLLNPTDGRTYVGKVLLFGLEGKISVNGGNYDGAMPAWQALSDDDIAAVLNYVSNAWNNGKSLPAGFKPFTADEIKALRMPELTSAAVYALRSGTQQAGGGGTPATASGAAGTVPVSFTADQVTRGSDIYAERCVQCHGDTLDNGEFGGAPLNGSYFKKHWGGGSVAALVAFMKAKMPPDRPGSLTDQSYAELTAFLLDANDYPKGDKELPADAPSQQAMSLKRGQ
ncbi:c-type cytochrome [Bradyrhizobium sp. dw_78]|uniref:c-type cytochrome n=1 Tax=Bradyrhizobium sp. dw_78 TaxID=2719793 RepID=UPI001BD4D48B|nr:c-type cytochrome [Bradyrhizobium sp. dw_78]